MMMVPFPFRMRRVPPHRRQITPKSTREGARAGIIRASRGNASRAARRRNRRRAPAAPAWRPAAAGAGRAADAPPSRRAARGPSCGSARERRARASRLVVPLPSTSSAGAYASMAPRTSSSRCAVSMTRCKSTRGAPAGVRSSTASPHFSLPGSSAATRSGARSSALMASPLPPASSRPSR